MTTTATPVTERTTTIGSGKVWYVNGNTVIVTLPNNENRMYKVQGSYRFNVNGQSASVHHLRKGVIVSGEKIVESPHTEIASNTEVTGHAPPPAEPKALLAEAPAPAREEAASAAAHEQVAEAKPSAELPKIGRQVPLAGILGPVIYWCGAVFPKATLR